MPPCDSHRFCHFTSCLRKCGKSSGIADIARTACRPASGCSGPARRGNVRATRLARRARSEPWHHDVGRTHAPALRPMAVAWTPRRKAPRSMVGSPEARRRTPALSECQCLTTRNHFQAGDMEPCGGASVWLSSLDRRGSASLFTRTACSLKRPGHIVAHHTPWGRYSASTCYKGCPEGAFASAAAHPAPDATPSPCLKYAGGEGNDVARFSSSACTSSTSFK